MPSGAYLIDTNVISELRRPRRSAAVVEWIEAASSDSLFISVVTIGEITKGIAKRGRRSGRQSVRLRRVR